MQLATTTPDHTMIPANPENPVTVTLYHHNTTGGPTARRLRPRDTFTRVFQYGVDREQLPRGCDPDLYTDVDAPCLGPGVVGAALAHAWWVGTFAHGCEQAPLRGCAFAHAAEYRQAGNRALAIADAVSVTDPTTATVLWHARRFAGWRRIPPPTVQTVQRSGTVEFLEPPF